MSIKQNFPTEAVLVSYIKNHAKELFAPLKDNLSVHEKEYTDNLKQRRQGIVLTTIGTVSAVLSYLIFRVLADGMLESSVMSIALIVICSIFAAVLLYSCSIGPASALALSIHPGEDISDTSFA